MLLNNGLVTISFLFYHFGKKSFFILHHLISFEPHRGQTLKYISGLSKASWASSSLAPWHSRSLMVPSWLKLAIMPKGGGLAVASRVENLLLAMVLLLPQLQQWGIIHHLLWSLCLVPAGLVLACCLAWAGFALYGFLALPPLPAVSLVLNCRFAPVSLVACC